MAIISVKQSAAWSSSLMKGLAAKFSGVWGYPQAAYVRSGGVWTKVYSGIPSNMIIMYPSSAYVTSSFHGTANTALQGYFPQRYDAYGALTTRGAGTHTPQNSSIVATDSLGQTLRSATLASTGQEHYHNVPSHGHATAAGNLPNSVDVVPYTSASVILSGALFLTNGATAACLTAYLAAGNRYLRFMAAGGLPAGTLVSHSHGAATVSTGVGISPDLLRWRSITSSTYTDLDHTHSANHTDGVATPVPYSIYLGLYQYSGGPASSLSFLPVGTIAMFTSDVYPDGWSAYATMDSERIVKVAGPIGTKEGTGWTHTHTVSVTTGAASVGIIGAVTAGTTYGGAWLKTHTHAFIDYHTANHQPPCITVRFGIKNS